MAALGTRPRRAEADVALAGSPPPLCALLAAEPLTTAPGSTEGWAMGGAVAFEMATTGGELVPTFG